MNEDKILTAKEFSLLHTKEHGMYEGWLEDIMKNFAKYHVERALKEASQKAEVRVHTESFGDYETSYHVNSHSILNAYPLDQIK